jgi:branched-chain amino acid transport system substrate-binding protein
MLSPNYPQGNSKETGGRVTKRILVGSVIGTALIGVVLAFTVSGAVAPRSAATPLPASSCGALQGTGDNLIASDFPLQGAGRTQDIQMTKAIAYILGQAGWKAGSTTLAYQSCDDATAQAGKWDSGKCSTNANAYANDASVIAEIGTFNSGCAEIEIPINNRAPNGPLAQISPANTYVGLTHGGPGTAAGEPNKYYPTGTRNYARVVAADDFQGAADATLAQQLGIKKLFILNDKEAYGLGVATNTKNAAVKLGIKIVGFTAWDGKASSYEATALKIKKSGAQGVFLGGLICENGGKLIKDLVANAPGVKILAPDGFTPISADVQQSGGKAEGMTVSVAGLPVEKLPASGKAFGKAFCASQGAGCSGGQPDPYSVYAAAAAQVFLAAIGASDGSRASINDEVFKVSANTVLGTIKFNQNGDVTSNPVTIYKIKGGKSTTLKVIVPKSSLVATA